MSSNAHFKHVSNVATTGKNYGCVVCHAATVSNNTTVSVYASHVNGSKDVTYSGLGASSTWDSVGATCASYCHSNGKGAGAVTTPIWTSKATGACGACHATSTVIGGATLISTNGHFAHFRSASNSYGPMLTQRSATSTSGCAACHTYTGDLAATHVNGTVDVPSANCSTSCHKQVASINPAWTSGPVTCESCHTTTGGALSVINGITAPDKTGFPSQGHGQYLINAANVKCLDCHLRNDRHINSNAAVHYTRLGASYTGINENNLCVVCHNDPTKVTNANRQNMSTHVLDKIATPTPDMCSACHEVHGSSNVLSINSKITFNALSAPVTIVFTDKNNVASYVNTTTNRGFCQVCHTQTKYYTRDNKGNPASHNPGSLCLSCHDHKAAYAFKPNGNCDACHGYPPVLSVAGIGKQNNYSSARLQNYSGGGGAHAVLAHIPPAAKASDAWTYCVACHNQGSAAHSMDTSVWVPANSTAQRKANVTVTVDPQYKFNAAKPLNASQYRKPTPGASGSCWNASCHMQPTPQWGNDK
jgi:predicted CxxxxCH...CXXCH cytochrome family protein